MSVVSVREVNTTFTEAQDGNRQYVSIYEIRTDSRANSIADIYLAFGLPQRGDSYYFNGTSDPLCVCLSRQFQLRDPQATAQLWTCTCNFDSKGSKDDPGDRDKSPTDWAWKFSGSFLSRMKSPDTTIDGRAIVNINREDFLPPPEYDDPDAELVVQKNTPTISLVQWVNYKGKVNSDTIWGAPARSFKIVAWTWQPKFTAGGQSYVENQWRIHYREDLFTAKPLNQGFREVFGIDVNGKPAIRQILDSRSVPISKPQLLDSDGTVLPFGAPPKFFDGTDPALMPFKLENEATFSSIFPTSLPYPVTT